MSISVILGDGQVQKICVPCRLPCACVWCGLTSTVLGKAQVWLPLRDWRSDMCVCVCTAHRHGQFKEHGRTLTLFMEYCALVGGLS